MKEKASAELHALEETKELVRTLVSPRTEVAPVQSMEEKSPLHDDLPPVESIIEQRRRRLEEFDRAQLERSSPSRSVEHSTSARVLIPAEMSSLSKEEKPSDEERAAADARAWADAVRKELREKKQDRDADGDNEDNMDDDEWMEKWKAKKAQAKAAFEALIRQDEEDFARQHQSR